jgi:hypothetical protein
LKVEDEALQAVEAALEALDHHPLSPPKLNQPALQNSKVDTPASTFDEPADPPAGLPNSLTEEKRPKKGKKGKGPKAKPSNHDNPTPAAPPPAPITRGRKRKLPKGWVYSAINEVDNSVEPPKRRSIAERRNPKPSSSGPTQRASTRLRAATSAKEEEVGPLLKVIQHELLLTLGPIV